MAGKVQEIKEQAKQAAGKGKVKKAVDAERAVEQAAGKAKATGSKVKKKVDERAKQVKPQTK